MAANTLTYTLNMATTPKSIVSGTITLPWDFNSGANKTGTLSDKILLGKVPNHAVVTQSHVRLGVSTAAAAHWALVLFAVDAEGTLSLHATLKASMTQSLTAAVFSDYIPQKVSLSDDRAVQHCILALNCTTGGSATISVSIQGSIQFLTDGTKLA